MILLLLLLFLLPRPLQAEPQPSQSPPAQYTVIILTSGLDEHILNTMDEVMTQAPYPDVNVTWQFKFDAPPRAQRGIRRWSLPASQPADGRLRTQRIAPHSTPICDSDLITSFIDWSVEQYPAQHYILILGSHAVGWLPSADTTGLQCPSALFDSTLPPDPTHPCYLAGFGQSISLHDQLQAIARSRLLLSGQHFQLVMHDACLMGRAEVMAEYTQVADYMIATPEKLLDQGIPYAPLFRSLAQLSSDATDADFRQQACQFVDHTVGEGWQATPDERSTSCFSASLFLADLRRFQSVTNVVRAMADELTQPASGYADAYADALPQVRTNALMYVDDLPRASQLNSFDLYHLSSLLAATGSPRMRSLHDSLLVALDDCLYLRAARLVSPTPVLSPRTRSPFSQVSLSLSLFAWGRTANPAQWACYRRTRFCQLTGLDRFFLINSEQPVVGRTSFPAHHQAWHTYY